MSLSEENKDRLRFAYLCALFCWTVLVFGQLFTWIHDNEMFAVERDHKPFLTDICIYYAAGKLAVMAMHEPTNVYDIQLQDKVLKAVIAPVMPEKPWLIQAPPPVFVLASALTFMTLPIAWGVFCLIGDSLFFLALYKFLKDDLPSRKEYALIALGVCSSFPFWMCNRLGQLALYTVPSTLLFWALLRSKRQFSSGLSVALMLMKFQYLPFISAAGVVVGKVRFIIGAILSCLLVLIASGMLLGWQNIVDYPRIIGPAEFATNLYTGINPADQQNLRALLVRVTRVDSPFNSELCMIACLAVALALLIFWWKGLKNVDADKRFKFMCTVTIACSLVFSPHAHTQDYLLLAAPVAWLWLEAQGKPDPANKWSRIFVKCMPPLTWLLFVLDGIKPPVPLFLLLLPPLITCAWFTFCRTDSQQA